MKNKRSPLWIDFSPLYSKANDISEAYKNGNLVFFLGAGASKAYANEMPNWKDLLHKLLSELSPKSPEQRNEIRTLINHEKFTIAAEAIKNYHETSSGNDLLVYEKIVEIIKQSIHRSNIDPKLHLALLEFSVPIFTTNFDSIIEDVISEYKINDYARTFITYQDEEDASLRLSPTQKRNQYVFKLHGSIDKAKSLIFDESSYFKFYFNNQWASSLELLRHILSSKMVIFVGYSLSDPEIMFIMREATRYSSSYQHIALMAKKEITETEKRLLQTNYKIDPILYNEHIDLPLYIMEMRTFSPQQKLTFGIKNNLNKINQALNVIKENYFHNENIITIIFGSYAKYGNFAREGSDIDILILTENKVIDEKIEDKDVDNLLQHRLDITSMPFEKFQSDLSAGDLFASNILLTGCVIQDYKDRYGLLSRGFEGNYDYSKIIENIEKRCQLMWLRLCIHNHNLEEVHFIRTCYQWMITIMQLLLLKDNYPTDTILSLSLLGNPRFVIKIFSERFEIDENYCLSIMDMAKGYTEKITLPELPALLFLLQKSVEERFSNEDLENLFSREYILTTNYKKVEARYSELKIYIDTMMKGRKRLSFGYVSTDVEVAILNRLTKNKSSLFDYLFFVELFVFFQNEDNKYTIEKIKECLEIWREKLR